MSRTLVNVLVEIYPREEDARRISADIGLPVGLFPDSPNALDRWQEIVYWAKDNGRAGLLLGIAQQEYPDNLHVRQLDIGEVYREERGGHILLSTEQVEVRLKNIEEELRRIAIIVDGSVRWNQVGMLPTIRDLQKQMLFLRYSMVMVVITVLGLSLLVFLRL
jgi:hypothetical protein